MRPRSATSIACLILIGFWTLLGPTGVAFAGPGKGTPAPSAAASPDDGGPSPEARAANSEALELSKNGHYAEALEKFQRAYDLSPSYVILYNIGRMARFTQDFARSLTAFQRFLNEGKDIETSHRSEVEQEIAALASLVAWVTVKTDAGAHVFVDGQEVGVAPIDRKIPMNPGARSFRADKAGASVTKDITLKAGDASNVVLDFEKPPVTVPKPVVNDRFRFPSGVVVAAWVVTGAFTAGAVVTGTAAIVTSNSLKSDVYVGPARAPSPDSPIAKKASRVNTLATASNAFIATAIVAGSAAIAFSIVDAVAGPAQDPSKEPSPKPPSKPASLDLEVGVGSLFLTGKF